MVTFADPTKPTRAEIEIVVGGNQRLLRAFERLFEVSGEETPKKIGSLESTTSTLASISSALTAPITNYSNLGIACLESGLFVFVSDKSDLPSQNETGAIALQDKTTYFFLGEVDLEGAYLVGGQSSVILGGSSENSLIKSTGLDPLTALIQSEWALPIRHITLDGLSGGKLLDLDAAANPNQALDWYGVNLQNTQNIGSVVGYNNFVVGSCAVLNAGGLVFDGSVGTISFNGCIFVSDGVSTILTIAATAIITRRFIVTYSAFVVFGASAGLDVSASATIPTEGYVLDTCNFSGGGTYQAGVGFDTNQARFIENRGIANTLVLSGYTMQGNALATTISAVGTPVKIAGTTTAASVSQKFDNTTSNRALFTGAIPRTFKVTGVFSLSSGNNNQIGLYVAVNGVVIVESQTHITTDAGGRLENAYVQVLTSLSENDYVEMFCENNTAATNITVENMNVILEASD